MPHATAADIEQAAPPAQHGMASEADVLPEQSFGAAAQEYWNKINPVSMAQGIAQNVYHPVEAMKRWGDVNNRLLSNAEDAAKKGNYTEAAAHALHYVLNGIPGLGEALDEAGTKMRDGDIAGGLADTAALGTQIIAGAKAPAIAKAASTAGTYAAAGAKAAAPGVLGGMAKAGAGEVLAKLPGMELPARFGLQYPALRQVAKAIEKGHEAGMKALGPKAAPVAAEAEAATATAAPRPARASEAPAAAAPTPETSPAPGKTAADLMNEEMAPKEAAPTAAPATPKAPGQAMAEADGQTWSKLGQDDKLAYAQLEGARASSEARNPAAEPKAARGLEHYGVKAAEVQPQAQSTPAAPPQASATPTAKVQPIRTAPPAEAQDIDFQQRYGEQEQPEVAKFLGHEQPAPEPPTPKPASGAVRANAQAKADRFVAAIRKFNSDNPQQALSADELSVAGDEEKSMLTRGLQQGGYLKNTETFTDKSFPYILSKLKAAEAVSRQTIKPPKGFSLGEMGTTH